MKTIAHVSGAGSWGTALAVHLARVGHDVRLWARDAALVERDARDPARTRATCRTSRFPDRVDADRRARGRRSPARTFVVVAVPSHGLRAVVAARPAPFLRGRGPRQRDQGPRGRLAAADVAGASRGDRRGAAGRRALGAELRARGRARAADRGARRRRATRRRRRTCRTTSAARRSGSMSSDDVAGVEIGGALKNVIAIAAGVVEGLGLGHNALAALITRGLAEISRLAVRRGRPARDAGRA